MNETQRLILQRLVEGKTTQYTFDVETQVQLLKMSRYDQEVFDYVRKMILEGRKRWLIQMTIWQGKVASKCKIDSDRERRMAIHTNTYEEHMYINNFIKWRDGK